MVAAKQNYGRKKQSKENLNWNLIDIDQRKIAHFEITLLTYLPTLCRSTLCFSVVGGF